MARRASTSMTFFLQHSQEKVRRTEVGPACFVSAVVMPCTQTPQIRTLKNRTVRLVAPSKAPNGVHVAPAQFSTGLFVAVVRHRKITKENHDVQQLSPLGLFLVTCDNINDDCNRTGKDIIPTCNYISKGSKKRRADPEAFMVCFGSALFGELLVVCTASWLVEVTESIQEGAGWFVSNDRSDRNVCSLSQNTGAALQANPPDQQKNASDSLPFWSELGEVFLTRLTNHIVIEVMRTPSQRSTCTHSVLKERNKSKPTKSDWQLVVGMRGREGGCDLLSCAAGRFPLKCANSFAFLERELDNDEEYFYSARLDDEQT
eukprot:3132757-Amphidinium_carterae.1